MILSVEYVLVTFHTKDWKNKPTRSPKPIRKTIQKFHLLKQQSEWNNINISVLHFFLLKRNPKTKKHVGKKKAEPHDFQKWPSLRVTLAKALKRSNCCVEVAVEGWRVEGWRVDLQKKQSKVHMTPFCSKQSSVAMDVLVFLTVFYFLVLFVRFWLSFGNILSSRWRAQTFCILCLSTLIGASLNRTAKEGTLWAMCTKPWCRVNKKILQGCYMLVFGQSFSHQLWGRRMFFFFSSLSPVLLAKSGHAIWNNLKVSLWVCSQEPSMCCHDLFDMA